MSLHTGQDLVHTGRGGAVPIMGTFAVNLPLITSTTPSYSTIVTGLAGITANHAVVIQDMGLVSGASANSTASSARIVFSVQPQDAQITITYVNNAATVNASDKVYSYIAVRP